LGNENLDRDEINNKQVSFLQENIPFYFDHGGIMHLWFDDVGSECMPTFSAFITSVGDVGNSCWLAAVWPSSISPLLCMSWRQ